MDLARIEELERRFGRISREEYMEGDDRPAIIRELLKALREEMGRSPRTVQTVTGGDSHHG